MYAAGGSRHGRPAAVSPPAPNPPLRRRGEDCCHAAKLKVALACLVLVEERAPHPGQPHAQGSPPDCPCNGC